MSSDPPSTRESDADRKASWQNINKGPSSPFLSNPIKAISDSKEGHNLKQYEENMMRQQPSAAGFTFDPTQIFQKAPAVQTITDNINQRVEQQQAFASFKPATSPIPSSSSSRPIKTPKRKPAIILTEHKQPPIDIHQDDSNDDDNDHNKPLTVTKEMLSSCIRVAEQEFLAGIYLEIEKNHSISECYKLKSLNLNRQGITALNNLGQCFPYLEKLKVSHNELTELHGLPDSLCYLYANNNRLTSIDLNNLTRLQQLNLSYNYLSQLENLSELKSLRALDLGHNFIRSYSPLGKLEGIVSLSLKSNDIHRLNEFQEFNQCSNLEILDLSFNRIERLESIESLTNLRELNIDHNNVKIVNLNRPMERLCKLKLSYNRLKSFDISLFPDIRLLYLDDNQIERIMGAACTKRMDTFSLRDQGKTKVEMNIQHLRGIRKLYLSGSPFKSLHQMFDFYSLEYLELCAADIEELPSQFSKQVPNLGTLYLSMNRIADIRPLKKLKYLKKLVLIDNRLTSLNEVLGVVKQMKRLACLDLRQNPMCTNFYLPLNPPAVKSHSIQNNDHHLNEIPISPYIATTLDNEWAADDEVFVHSLSDHWKTRRAVYRSLFILECPRLIDLDHIPIHSTEREQAPRIIQQYSFIPQGRSGSSHGSDYLDNSAFHYSV
ncbi:hypothetical protein RMCBS344292_09874 [Rhizopus microsporus]|nr:hypothetical protein RMCBS344292_09874 [Rhizopus microsporus]